MPGGAAAGAAIQYRLLVGSGLDPTTIGTGLTATTFISSATLFALPVLALPAIVFGAPAPGGLVQSAWLGAALFVLADRRRRRPALRRPPAPMGRQMIERIQNRMHKERPPKTGTPEKLVRERNAIRGTLGSRWWLALITAWGNWLLDYLALLAALTAVGAKPRPALVLLAYVAATVLGMIPITPGGLGFVEAGLTATLTLAGVSAADAVLATLAYRLVSYWLPLVAGPFAYLAHRRRYLGRAKAPVAERRLAGSRQEREELPEVGHARAAPLLALGRERLLRVDGGIRDQVRRHPHRLGPGQLAVRAVAAVHACARGRPRARRSRADRSRRPACATRSRWRRPRRRRTARAPTCATCAGASGAHMLISAIG